MVKCMSCPKSKLCRYYEYDLRLFSKVITHAHNFIVQYYHYRPQRSLGKVIFLHMSVILFTGGVVSQHALQVSRPTPRREVEGGLAGGVSRPTHGEVSRPTPGGSIPACTEADPPTATAAGGTHPTGMHSCSISVSYFKYQR